MTKVAADGFLEMFQRMPWPKRFDKKIEKHCSTTFWLFLLGAKRFTITNVVHFFKKRCIVAFSVRNLIFLTKFGVWTVPRFIVFLGLVPVPRLGIKGLVKCHMSVSQVLNAPTYYTTLVANDALPDPTFCN